MIVVTGASGTIGKGLIRGLVSQGHKVRALVLPFDPHRDLLERAGAEIAQGDITCTSSLVGLCDGADTVYHMAAVILTTDANVYDTVNVGGTQHMLAAATQAGVAHFVYVSSASVVYPESTPYSRSKRTCESIVRSTRELHYTIVRPTLVYDETGGEELFRFWRQLERFPVALLVGRGQAKKRPVHVDDLVQGLVAIAHNPHTYGQSYNLAGGEEITMRELARLLLSYSARPRPLVSIPAPLCFALGLAAEKLFKRPPITRSAVRGVTQDANLDIATAARDLGYAPCGVREGFARCYGPSDPNRKVSS